MKALLNKELRLALHPTSFMFLGLSAMILIPNYPYFVVLFYCTLSVFFICIQGRENKDIFFTMLLPVKKEDIVTGRMMLVVLLQLAQAVIAIPFAILRNSFSMNNLAGMEANVAFFGMSLLMLGVFNYIFFTNYYSNVTRVGMAFVKGSIGLTAVPIICEGLVQGIPRIKTVLDTSDPLYLKEKLVVLAIGLIACVFLTLISYKRSKISFIKQEI